MRNPSCYTWSNLGSSTVRERGIDNVDDFCGISWALGVLSAEISCAEGARMVSLKSEGCSTRMRSSSATESADRKVSCADLAVRNPDGITFGRALLWLGVAPPDMSQTCSSIHQPETGAERCTLRRWKTKSNDQTRCTRIPSIQGKALLLAQWRVGQPVLELMGEASDVVELSSKDTTAHIVSINFSGGPTIAHQLAPSGERSDPRKMPCAVRKKRIFFCLTVHADRDDATLASSSESLM